MAGPFPEGRKRQDSKQFSHGFGVRERVVDGLPFYVLQNVFDVAVRIQAVNDCGPDDGEQFDCVYGAGFAPGGLKRLPVDDKGKIEIVFNFIDPDKENASSEDEGAYKRLMVTQPGIEPGIQP